MFGKRAGLIFNLASAANTAATANTFYIYAQLSSGVENGRANGKTPAFAGGHEQYEWITVIGHQFTFYAGFRIWLVLILG